MGRKEGGREGRREVVLEGGREYNNIKKQKKTHTTLTVRQQNGYYKYTVPS